MAKLAKQYGVTRVHLGRRPRAGESLNEQNVAITLEIDEEELLYLLVPRAALSRSRKTKLAGGAICLKLSVVP